jgi:Na+/H+ antiporter NhaD/arsenite permease-like protein
MPIEPYSVTGLVVLAIFVVSMICIMLESQLHMNKFKPALFMMTSLIVIGLHYQFSNDDPNRFSHFLEMQHENEMTLFSLIAFMAFTWMIVEVLYERGVFSSLNNFLMAKGLGPKGMFWATGALSALLSPFLNNITTAMIFGKSIKGVSNNQRYTHVAMCNIIVASNSGVWFLGTVTSLMVVLAGKISVGGLLLLAPAGLIGWIASAAVLHWLYLRNIEKDVIDTSPAHARMKKGGWGIVLLSVVAIIGTVLLNVFLHIKIEFAIGIGLGLVALYAWHLKRRGHDLRMLDQLQKVEWSTLIFFIGIITGVAALNHVGWLSYITRLFEVVPPTWVNVTMGLVSGLLDNVPVAAGALMANPNLGADQWALQALMVGIGGSLTVIGSAAGIMVMSVDKSYTFGTHLRFMPVLLVNFFVSLAVWYVQYQVLGLY